MCCSERQIHHDLHLSQIAAVDLLVEGQYAKLMVAMPHTGSDCVTWVWVCYMLGSLLAMWVVGPLSDLFKSTQNVCTVPPASHLPGRGSCPSNSMATAGFVCVCVSIFGSLKCLRLSLK